MYLFIVNFILASLISSGLQYHRDSEDDNSTNIDGSNDGVVKNNHNGINVDNSQTTIYSINEGVVQALESFARSHEKVVNDNCDCHHRVRELEQRIEHLQSIIDEQNATSYYEPSDYIHIPDPVEVYD